MKLWSHPEGLRVLADGSWLVGELPARHEPTLRRLKQHLVFEEGGAFVVDGPRRVPVQVEGPAYEVLELLLDEAAGTAGVRLDDGSQETIEDDSLGMDDGSGRFECRVRAGRARAAFSRGAHQALLEHAEEDDGRFYLRVGACRLSIRV